MLAGRIVGLCAFFALLATAAPAGAAVSCVYDGGTKVLTVTMSANNDWATVYRSGSDVKVGMFGSTAIAVACTGSATVGNTDTIAVQDTSSATTTVSVHDPADLAPGFTTSETGVSEIEMTLSNVDRLLVVGDPTEPNVMHLGSGGLNWNQATGDSAPDAEIVTVSAPFVRITGGEAADTITGQGGAGTGGPTATLMQVHGGSGADQLTDGNSGAAAVTCLFFAGCLDPAGLNGDAGDDVLTAGPTYSDLEGGPGNDVLNIPEGSYGPVSYDTAPSPVRVDLSVTGVAQDTGGAGSDTINGTPDRVKGSPNSDRLLGSDRNDVFFAGGGDDVMEGRAGNDYFSGESGQDVVSYESAPSGVTASLASTAAQDTGGAGTDSFATDLEGLVGSAHADTLTGGTAADRIVVADGGVVDTVTCGDGSDSVTADDVDSLAADCEGATRADTATPDTVIDSGPAETTTDRTVSFAFSSNEAGAAFECRLDGGDFRACGSPHTAGPLADGQHTFEVRARDAAGHTDGSPAARSFSVVTPPPAVDPGPVPMLDLLTLAPAAFRAAAKGGSTAAKRGTRVSYSLNTAATVSFTVEKATAGRRSGKRCVAKTKKNRDAKRCTLWKLLEGSFSDAGEAGANRFRFTGRLGGRALKPGRYRMVAAPVDATRAVRARTARFRVLGSP